MAHDKFDPRLMRQMQYAGDTGLIDAIVLVNRPGPYELTDDGTWLLSILERIHVQANLYARSFRLLPRSSSIIITATAAFLYVIAECNEVRHLSATTVDFLSGQA